MAKEEQEGFCPAREAIRLLERRWAIQVIRALAKGPLRFCQIQDAVGAVHSVTLTRRLREMERQGILVRRVRNTIPPWVEYELTPQGRELNDILSAIEGWARRWMERGRTPEAAEEPEPAQEAR